MTKVPHEAKGMTRGALVAQDVMTGQTLAGTPRLSWTCREFIRGPLHPGRCLLGDMSQGYAGTDEAPPSLHIPVDSKDRLGGSCRLCHPPPTPELPVFSVA